MAAALSACNPHSGAVDVIFDTDMGNDVDDVVALDVLHKYVDAGKARILAVGASKDSPQAPEFIDIMNTWYGHPDIPIGVMHGGPECYQDDFCRKVCDLRSDDGAPAFQRSQDSYDALLPSHILYRKILASRPDHSVTMVVTGFYTNMSRLLDSAPDEWSPLCGIELVEKKVRSLVIMGAMFAPEEKPEYNVRRDIPAAQNVYRHWPTELVTSPGEVGSRVDMHPETIESGFGWCRGLHPLVESYKSYKTMPYSRHMWDVTSVVYAVEGGALFSMHPSCDIEVDDEGNTTMTNPGQGSRKVLKFEPGPGQTGAFEEHMVALATTPPAKRR